MAVVPMKRVTIYGPQKQRKAVLEALQRRSVLDVQELDLQPYGFEKMETSAQRATFTKAANSAQTALGILNQYQPEEKKLFAALEGRKSVSVQDYEAFIGRADKISAAAARLAALSKEIAELNAEIVRRETQIQMLQPWLALDVPLGFAGTRRTAAFAGTFPEGRTLEEILEEYQRQLAEASEPEQYAADFHIISTSPEQTCVFVLCLRGAAEKVENILRSMGFARPAISSASIPAERVKRHETKIHSAQTRIGEIETEIAGFGWARDDLKLMMDYYSMRIEKYEVLEKVNQQRHVFSVSGYVPQPEAAALETELTARFPVAVETEDVSEEETPPVLLKNNALSAPVESVLETYSLPGKGEIDPTTMMAAFYYVLFGMMLSDAAYGVLMMLACGIALLKFRNMESGMKKTLQMFFYCGISTTFWGVMFGGYFGDAVTVISETFFGKTVTIPPLWFAPVDDPMRMLIFSFAIGIVHIFAGLGIKLYQNIKAGDWRSGIYDTVFWYLLVGGGVVYLLSMQMFVDMAGLKFILPPAVGTAAAALAGVGALGIILFGGRSSKNPVKRLAKGLYELYGVTSYLSDILSYSRLLALGLATGVIASVFNKMGSMFGSGILGFILFLVVFLIGHTLNIGINLLGAYVHTNRLQFVEFFGKFYDGGGEKYTPYGVHTKYYKIEEKKV